LPRQIEQRPARGRLPAIEEDQYMLAAFAHIRHEIEGRREPEAGFITVHPEVLQVIVGVADRRIEYHLAEQPGDIGVRCGGVLAQRGRQFGIGQHVTAR
jgi:hypothetical protein